MATPILHISLQTQHSNHYPNDKKIKNLWYVKLSSVTCTSKMIISFVFCFRWNDNVLHLPTSGRALKESPYLGAVRNPGDWMDQLLRNVFSRCEYGM